MMRKWTTLLLIALISVFLVACKSEDDKDSSKEDDTPNTSEQDKEDEEKEDDEGDDNESNDEGTNNETPDADDDLGFDFDRNGENIVTLQTEQNGVQIKLVYTAEGDVVKKQTAENVIPYASLGVQTADEAKEIPDLKTLIEQYKGVNGIKHDMDFQENELYENLEVDYEVIEYEEAKDLLGFQSEGDLTNGVSLTRSIEMLQAQGFEIVK